SAGIWAPSTPCPRAFRRQAACPVPGAFRGNSRRATTRPRANDGVRSGRSGRGRDASRGTDGAAVLIMKRRNGNARKRSVMERLSGAATRWTGSTAALMSAIALIVVWLLLGPVFHYSDTWQ